MDEITESSSPAELALIVGNDLFGEDSDLVVQDANPVTTIDNDTGKIVPDGKPGNDISLPGKPNQTQTQNLPQLKALPKSWKKDMEPHWAKLDPAVHDYVYNREADVMRGLQMYQEGHNLWTETTKPFADVLKQHPGVNPVSLIQQLLHNHLSITFGTQEQKQQLAKNLLKAYGIELPTGNETPPAAIPPELQAIKNEIQQLRNENQLLKRGLHNFQTSQQEIGIASQTKIVSDFFSDPKNEFAEEVGDNILHLIKTGAAVDLQSAYDLACMMNPAVRAKVLAKQQVTSPAGTQNPAKPDHKNISDSGDGNLRTRRKTSWEDDIDDIVKTHYPKH